MRKTPVIVTASVVAVLAAAGYYWYVRLSYLPAWYRNDGRVFGPPASDRGRAAPPAIAPFERLLRDSGRASIDDAEAAAILLHQVNGATGVDIESLVKASKSGVRSDTLDIEMVVDISRVSRGRLSHSELRALDVVTALSKGLSLDELYVRASLALRADSTGRTVPDPGSIIRIGTVPFTLRDLESRTGVRSADLFEKTGWSNIRINGDSIVFRRRR
jgi:hypothetical protein